MISRIELKNFMSHADTVIEPARGLTVLIGPNNCGKSAVVAALQILSHNDNSTYVLRHEAKRCRVAVTTEEGDTIVWRRGKTGGPAYEINGATFDRLKGAGQPEALANTLRLPKVVCDRDDVDIHFGEQKSPVFLVRDSARTAADFFASSSDAGRMMKMQSLHKQKVRDAKRELKTCSEEWLRVGQEMELLSVIPKIKREYEKLSKLSGFLDDLLASSKQLAGLILEMKEQQATLEQLGRKSAALGRLSPMPQMEPVDELSGLLGALRVETRLEERLKKQALVVGDLEPPPVLSGVQQLGDLILRFREVASELEYRTEAGEVLGALPPLPELFSTGHLQMEIETLQQSSTEAERLKTEMGEVAQEIAAAKLAIVEWAERNPRCPTCDQSIGVDHWFTHDHQDCSEEPDG